MVKALEIKDLKVGSKVVFVPCGKCSGKLVCFFCKKGVKNTGVVVAVWLDFNIPTVEVEIKGAKHTLEMTQDDLENPEITDKIIV